MTGYKCRCGSPIHDLFSTSLILCKHCNASFSCDDNVVRNIRDKRVETSKYKRLADYFFLLDPMVSPVSPIAIIDRIITNNYYRRLVSDVSIGLEFKSHYLDNAPNSGVFVDVGCGKGRIVKIAEHLDYETYGIDLREDPFWTNCDKAKFFVGHFIEHLPFEDASVDIVTIISMIDYLDDAQLKNLFEEVSRVLDPKHGHLFLYTLNSKCKNLSAERRHFKKEIRNIENTERIAHDAGLKIKTKAFEGHAYKILPRLQYFFRQKLRRPSSYDYFKFQTERSESSGLRHVYYLMKKGA